MNNNPVNPAGLTGLRHRRRRPRPRRPRRPFAVAPRPVDPRQAVASLPGRTLIAAAGAGRFRALKREGDGATPVGRLVPLAVLWRPDRVAAPDAVLPGRPAAPRDGWSDDPADFLYNRYRRLPSSCGHERLWRDDGLYDVLVVTDHNQRPRVRGRGSAIFVHVARPGLLPTAGCLAFAAGDWRRLGRVIAGRAFAVRAPPRPVRRARREKRR